MYGMHCLEEVYSRWSVLRVLLAAPSPPVDLAISALRSMSAPTSYLQWKLSKSSSSGQDSTHTAIPEGRKYAMGRSTVSFPWGVK